MQIIQYDKFCNGIKLYLIVGNADNDARYPNISGIFMNMYQPYVCLFTF